MRSSRPTNSRSTPGRAAILTSPPRSPRRVSIVSTSRQSWLARSMCSSRLSDPKPDARVASEKPRLPSGAYLQSSTNASACSTDSTIGNQIPDGPFSSTGSTHLGGPRVPTRTIASIPCACAACCSDASRGATAPVLAVEQHVVVLAIAHISTIHVLSICTCRSQRHRAGCDQASKTHAAPSKMRDTQPARAPRAAAETGWSGRSASNPCTAPGQTCSSVGTSRPRAVRRSRRLRRGTGRSRRCRCTWAAAPATLSARAGAAYGLTGWRLGEPSSASHAVRLVPAIPRHAFLVLGGGPRSRPGRREWEPSAAGRARPASRVARCSTRPRREVAACR